MNAATAKESPASPADSLAATPWLELRRHFAAIVKVAAAAAIVHLYALEGVEFRRVFLVAAIGFVVTLVLPLRHRLPAFVLLSFAGAFAVFGLADGAWLIAAGLLLISLCHLPVRMAARAAILVACGTLLAVSRAGHVEAPWSAAVWPILGSMFMFRLGLYLMSVNSPRPADRSPWAALGYFFMLPNLAFPLFPVVDYQTFRRTHYDKDAAAIYDQGLLWIARGLVQLLLYRLIYARALNDPVDVLGLGDLVQFLLSTLFLYLRVSGQFHLIVGLLHLFGFRLPETHRLYYLSHSFTELWRRINIYWTDFMMKAVFYPTYFRVKRMGPARALVISTSAVFVVTWILHSYQWFWLRGGFPITAQDALFWVPLGAFVIHGALAELRAPKKARQSSDGWSWTRGLQATATFAVFCFLWSIWSTDSMGQWMWMLGAAANIDVKGVVLIITTAAVLMFLGGRDWETGSAITRPWLRAALAPSRRTMFMLGVMLIAGLPPLRAAAPPAIARGIDALMDTGLNARDAALQSRGYYEQLDVRGQLNDRLADALSERAANWETFATTGVLQERRGDMLTRDLRPSRSVLWNGERLSTNSWGMRDREYARAKQPGVLRIALVGPSFVMGSGVSDGETFEALIEDRLAREFHSRRYQSVELLNFAVEGHTLPEQVAMLEDRVFAFQPDVVIATYFYPARSWTERYLHKIVWGGVQVKDHKLRGLLETAGLGESEGDLPLPFATLRQAARALGLHPRMPLAESTARIRWIADEVVEWEMRRFLALTRQHGARPIVMGLNAVIPDAPPRMPRWPDLERNGLKVIDLYGIYPESELPRLRVAEWDDHPNAAGHRLIADGLYPQLVQYLSSISQAERSE